MATLLCTNLDLYFNVVIKVRPLQATGAHMGRTWKKVPLQFPCEDCKGGLYPGHEQRPMQPARSGWFPYALPVPRWGEGSGVQRFPQSG